MFALLHGCYLCSDAHPKRYKFMSVHCGEETDIGDPRSYEHYWTNSWNKTQKKIQARTGFEPWPTGLNFFSGLIYTTRSVVFIAVSIAYIRHQWKLLQTWNLGNILK